MKDNPYLLRALYIILVPVVLLIILLNTGFLQRFIPAATVNGESYTVVEYNFYYFECMNSFLDENADRLEELGYDTDVDAGRQDYSDSLTWQEFFQAQAEGIMAETAYYCTLAEQAGYVLSEAELALVEARLEENQTDATNNGIKKLDNYYVAYFGAGMNEERFAQQLTRVVKAQAYKQYLIDTCAVSEGDIAAYLAGHPEEDYQAAQLKVISLDATEDRSTGEVGQAQLTALQARLDALETRYESGVSAQELQASFSTCAIGEQDGSLTATTAANLPEAIGNWCLKGQDTLRSGDTLAWIDGNTAYFCVFEGFVGSGRELDAIAVLRQQTIGEQQEAALADYAAQRNGFGLLLAMS